MSSAMWAVWKCRNLLHAQTFEKMMSLLSHKNFFKIYSCGFFSFLTLMFFFWWWLWKLLFTRCGLSKEEGKKIKAKEKFRSSLNIYCHCFGALYREFYYTIGWREIGNELSWQWGSWQLCFGATRGKIADSWKILPFTTRMKNSSSDYYDVKCTRREFSPSVHAVWHIKYSKVITQLNDVLYIISPPLWHHTIKLHFMKMQKWLAAESRKWRVWQFMTSQPTSLVVFPRSCCAARLFVKCQK